MNEIQNSDFLFKSLEKYAEYLNIESGKIKKCIGNKESSVAQQCIKQINEKFSSVSADTEKSIKLIKKLSKTEDDLTELEHIMSELNKSQKQYAKIIGKMKKINSKINLHNENIINKKIIESANVLKLIKTTADIIEKRVSICKNKDKFEAQHTIERFDRWIAKQNKIDPDHKNDYDHLFSIVRAFQLKNKEIYREDYQFLEGIAAGSLDNDQNINENDKNDIKEFANELTRELTTALNRKFDVLQNIEIMIREKIPLDEHQKIYFAVILRQVLDNPFDLPYNPELPESLREFIDMEIPPGDPAILQAKIDSLKLIRKSYIDNQDPDRQEKILISGAGPAGLMFGLIYAMQGKDFTVIEKRSQGDKMRENIVGLGKEEDPSNLKMLQGLNTTGSYKGADMKLLNFFGLTDLLLAEKKAHQDASDIFSVKIKDLQNAMRDMILNIKETTEKEDLIHYDTEISEIIPSSEGSTATIHFTSKESQKIGDMQPTLVHITEGYHSKSRDLLGINVEKYTKPAMLAFSFFTKEKPVTQTEAIMQKLDGFRKFIMTIPSILKLFTGVLYHIIINNKDLLSSMFEIMGRGELLLRTPESDYFYMTIKPEEQEQMWQLSSEIDLLKDSRDKWADSVEKTLKKYHFDDHLTQKMLDDLLQKFSKDERLKWYQNSQEREMVFSQLANFAQRIPEAPQLTNKDKIKLSKGLEDARKMLKNLDEIQKDLKEFFKNKAITDQRTLDLINQYTFFKQKSEWRDYQRTEIAYSQVQRAEINYLQSGQTQFYVGGDAASSTDPISGSGLRTTILRTVLASGSIDNSILSRNRINQSARDWSLALAERSMREEGLHMRGQFRPGTERLERYLDIANEDKVLTKGERQALLKMRSQAKVARTHANYKVSDELDLKVLQTKMRNKYIKKAQKLSFDNFVNIKMLNLNLTGKELEADIDSKLKGDIPYEKYEKFITAMSAALNKNPEMIKQKSGSEFGEVWETEFEELAMPFLPDCMEIAKFVSKNPQVTKKNFELFKSKFTKNLSLFNWMPISGLTNDEKQIFIKAWKAAMLEQPIQFTSKEQETLKKACSKVAVIRPISSYLKQGIPQTARVYTPEAWFVYLYTFTEGLKSQESPFRKK